jgi:hypothetical protein
MHELCGFRLGGIPAAGRSNCSASRSVILICSCRSRLRATSQCTRSSGCVSMAGAGLVAGANVIRHSWRSARATLPPSTAWRRTSIVALQRSPHWPYSPGSSRPCSVEPAIVVYNRQPDPTRSRGSVRPCSARRRCELDYLWYENPRRRSIKSFEHSVGIGTFCAAAVPRRSSVTSSSPTGAAIPAHGPRPRARRPKRCHSSIIS